MKKIYDVVIVGNGIIGHTMAYTLHKSNANLKIAVLGPNNKANCASVAAGAMLGCFGEVTAECLKNPYSIAKFEMSYQAHQQWSAWLEAINEELPKSDILPINKGTFLILNSKSGRMDSDNFDSIITKLKEKQEPYHEVDYSDIPGMRPAEKVRPIKSVFINNEGWISPQAILGAYEKILMQSKQIDFIDDEASTISIVNSSVSSLLTKKQQTIHSKQVIMCSGVLTQKLIDTIPEIKHKIPRLFAGLGCSLKVTNNVSVPNVIRTPNRSFACGLHVVPNAVENSLYIGATNTILSSYHQSPRTGHLYLLLNSVLDQVNTDLHASNLLASQSGNRPIPLDGFPLIGETSIAGLWIITGTYRDGFHQSPIICQGITNQILQRPSNLPTCFKPERTPIQTMTKEEAITSCAKQFLAGGYEFDMNMPKVGWDNFAFDLFYQYAKSIYDRYTYVFPPDFILLFQDNPNTVLPIPTAVAA